MSIGVDLSHWDAASDFSAAEAAALIAGIDPVDPDAARYKAEPALARISEAYARARALVAGPPLTPEGFRIIWSNHFTHALASTRVEAYPIHQKAPWPGDPERDWELPRRFQGKYGDLEQQRFTRAEIQRWLAATETPSAYAFHLDARIAGTCAMPGAASGAARAVAANDENMSMIRAALIAAYKAIWPTIDRDLKDASKNGLSSAAKAGIRGWDEAKALAWARNNNKLLGPQEAASVMSTAMQSLHRHVHKIQD